jgi:hypothetical protein
MRRSGVVIMTTRKQKEALLAQYPLTHELSRTTFNHDDRGYSAPEGIIRDDRVISTKSMR